MQPVLSLLVNGLNPAVISTAATTIKYFPTVPGASIGSAPSSTAPVAGFLPIPGAGRANGQLMRVLFAGEFIPSTIDTSSPTVNFGLYYITKSITAAALTDISALATSGARGTAGGGSISQPFKGVVEMQCTTNSGILQGNYTYQLDNETILTGALSAVSGINMAADQPFAICVGVTFSQDGTHTNVANLHEFVLEM